MSRAIRHYVFWALVSVSLFSAQSSRALDNHVVLAEEQAKSLGIVLAKPEPVSHVPVLYAPAKVVIPPTQEYIISATQAGLVTKLNAAIGDKVNSGAVLAEMNSQDLLMAQRNYLKAESDLALAGFSYQRDKKLLDDGVIAQRRWQETSAMYQAAASELDEHRQLLGIAGMTDAEIAKLKKTHKLSGLLAVRAPITGVVLERMVVAGARLDSLSPLFKIANLDELWLEINIPQERINQVKIGDKVLLEKPTNDSESLEQRETPVAIPVSAQISLIGQAVNPENQTILARAVLKHAPIDIRPGQRINTQIIQQNSQAAFIVPNTAIIQNERKSYVFVQTGQGFSVLPVNVLGKQGEQSTISGELTGNELIAVKGTVALKANWLGLGEGE
ncbi:efflux RND transporter periplasmic adaptor subunit [Methylocucumis oryzae]|uniref:efflux RND transporter periplasmic adaptor subunit n=1 Tax=Methylocucumis oryzae TaxID=1632867 RepID=UPI0006986953|nr:efflux RND transporter periplasmic adaptor subunit [Methylocucumis oryzae]